MSEKEEVQKPEVLPAKKQSQALTLKEEVEGSAFKSAIAKCLPQHVTPDRFVRMAIMAMTRTPHLKDCSKATVLQALMNLSQMGLEPDGRRAHLIPFKNNKTGGYDCQLIVDFKGLAELVMRTGLVSYIHADIVCDNDTFLFDKGELKTHTIDFKKPRGKPYAAYALCRFKDATEKAEIMSLEEIEAIRKRSRAGNSGPWVTDWNEMAKKTAFRRLSKWLPLSPEYRDTLEIDDDRLKDEPKAEAPVPLFTIEQPTVGEDEKEDGLDLTGAGEPKAKETPKKQAKKDEPPQSAPAAEPEAKTAPVVVDREALIANVAELLDKAKASKISKASKACGWQWDEGEDYAALPNDKLVALASLLKA